MLCTKLDSSTALSGVRERMLISTSARGKSSPTMPNRVIQSQRSSGSGASIRPSRPVSAVSEPTTNSRRVAWKRTTSTGTISDAGRPMNAHSDSRKPAVAASTPAVSMRIDGSQANETYAIVDEVAKVSASAHTSGMRARRANSRRFVGAVAIGPVAAKTASASSGSAVFAATGCPGARRSATAGVAGRSSITIHGMTPASANAAHIAIEKRQPRASATGTATSGGRKVENAIVVV